MQVELDGRQIRSAAEFHAEIARLLDFGPYYGKSGHSLGPCELRC
ncbi:barstar family protein [Micromonospora zamorensis]